MGTLEAVGVIAVGLSAGALSGMFGVGGAVLTTPGIRLFGATPIAAVGSTIPAIIPGALSGTYRYARAGLVDWRLGLSCGVSGAGLAVVGAWVAGLFDARWLMVLTAVLLAASGVRMLGPSRRPGPEPEPTATRVAAPSPPSVSEQPGEGEALPTALDTAVEPASSTTIATGAALGVGAVAGFIAGLLGVGGGVVMMPLFTSVLRVPIKTAVPASLVAVAIFSIPAMVAHALLGNIDWAYAALLVFGGVPGAQLGSKLTIGAGERTVRLMLGAFFVAVALLYGVRELVGALA